MSRHGRNHKNHEKNNLKTEYMLKIDKRKYLLECSTKSVKEHSCIHGI